nr:hypothetical protein [Halomonas socia]
MIEDVLSTLRWSVSLGAKFLRVVPYYTFIIILLTLVAQLSTVLSSFLPLKVIILLGSDGMPRYFPASFQTVDRDFLVVLLSAATVGFFLLALLANKLIDLATARASEVLLEKSQKLPLFENQDQVAVNGYQKYSSALAGLVFVCLALIGVGFFYLSMSLLLVGYCASLFIFAVLAARFFRAFNNYLEGNLSYFVSLTSNIGFFVAFAFLVFEFILWTPPGFIVAIVSLLLSRQIFSRISGFVNGVFWLNKQKQKLDVLFFHGKKLIPGPNSTKNKNIWSYLKPRVREEWLLPLLSNIDSSLSLPHILAVQWLDSSQQNIPQLMVSIKGDNRKFLIKLYEKNRTALAKHEASLMLDPPAGLPAPRLTLVTDIENLACHVYELHACTLLAKKNNKDAVAVISYNLALIKLPVGLRNRFLRSRPLLTDRLTFSLLERVRVAACNERQLQFVDHLIDKLPELKLKLNALPLVIFNPSMASGIWHEKTTDSYLSVTWEKWTLEPLGAGVPSARINKFLDFISQHDGDNNSCLKVDPNSVRLAAQALDLERLINKQQLSLALNKVKNILCLLYANNDEIN